MASSQVEVASSSSNPFGCVLRTRNNRGRGSGGGGGGGNGEAFEKNLKELVRDHLHTCRISVSQNNEDDNEDDDENVQYEVKLPHDKNLRCAISHWNGGGNDGNSSKQDKVLERWAAKQAKEMVSSLGKQGQQEQEQRRLDCDDQTTDSVNLAASSLVQIWEARLLNHPSKHNAAPYERSRSLNNHNRNHNHNIPDFNVGCSNSCVENDKPSSNNVNIPANNLNARDDSSCCSSFSSSSVDWDSASRRSCDAGESEKLRVSDIIKRLTCDGKNDLGEQFSGVGGGDSPRGGLRQQPVSSPRIIRGRQAFHDLLMQLEKERHKEIDSLSQRHAVSEFPQKGKGRIQSMLRLRSMQRCIAIQEQQRANSQSTRSITPSDANRSHQGSNITHLRERFSTSVEQQTLSTPSTPSEPTTIKSIDTGNSCSQLELPSTSNQVSEGNNGQQGISTIKESSAPHTIEQASAPKKLEETDPSPKSEACKKAREENNVAPNVTWEGTSSNIENLNLQETSQTSPSLTGWDENETEEEEEEEVAAELQDFEEVIDDWFSSIARPRSYWEDKRQAWYQEFLSSTPANNEIRQLLERRTVSTFLSSDFRERMDQLMVSRAQVQEDEEMNMDSQDGMGQLMLSYFQRHSHSSNAQEAAQEQETRSRSEEQEQVLEPQQHQHQEEEEESEEERVEEDEHQEESPSSCQFIEATDYFDQSDSLPIHSPSPLRTWDQSDDNEASDISERISAPLPFSPLQPESSFRDGQINHPSIEMELIYNLRGHMQQLQYEMSELRRSIQRCTEMQVQLLGVYPVSRNEKNPVNKTPKKRVCCICYETHVDSFLYRCGHMCTCLKCAHELQWSSGKCPICRAPILDVVRAYLDS